MAPSVGIAATVFDIAGDLLIAKPDGSSVQNSRKGNRRVSRTATLDGSCSYYDTGYAVADRDIEIEVPEASEETVARAEHIVQTYGEVSLCLTEGAFLCVPESFSVKDGTLKMVFMIKERIDE